MFAALQNLFAGAGGGGGGGGPGGPGGGGAPGMGVGGVPMMAGADLLGSLTKLQIDGLPKLGESGALMASGALTAGGAPHTSTTQDLAQPKAHADGADKV